MSADIGRMCILEGGVYLNIGTLFSDGEWCMCRLSRKPLRLIKWIANSTVEDAPFLTGVFVSEAGVECGWIDTADNHSGKVQYYGQLRKFDGEQTARLTRLETTYELIEWRKDRGIYPSTETKQVSLREAFNRERTLHRVQDRED